MHMLQKEETTIQLTISLFNPDPQGQTSVFESIYENWNVGICSCEILFRNSMLTYKLASVICLCFCFHYHKKWKQIMIVNNSFLCNFDTFGLIFKTVWISSNGHRRYFYESNWRPKTFPPSGAKFFDITL